MIQKVQPYSTPYSCYVNLTNKCNLHCLHCLGDYGDSLKNEFKLRDWKRVFRDIVESKVFYINISGGEPTQHPDFGKILQYLMKIRLHFILTTNGVFSERILKTIIKNKKYLIGIKISLDGYNATDHCFIRRTKNNKINKQIFEITMRNIKKFKDNKIPLTIATVLHSKNIENFDKFVKVIKKINPISWFISPIIPSGRGLFNREIKKDYGYYDKKFWQRLIEKSKRARINAKLIDLPFDMQEKEGIDYYECGGALSFCEINSDGLVSPCTLCRTCIPMDKIKFESLRHKSLRGIWKGKSFKKFRKFMNLGCDGCQAFSKCTKCIAQSFRYFNNGYSPTSYCIKNPNIKLNKKLFYQEKLKKDFNIEV